MPAGKLVESLQEMLARPFALLFFLLPLALAAQTGSGCDEYTPAPTGLPAIASGVTLPALPESVPCPVFPKTGAITTVKACPQLQPALSAMQCGQAVVIESGLRCPGNFTTAAVQCPLSNQALIIGSADFAEGAAIAGQRISQTAEAPWLETPNSRPAFIIANGAAGLYIDGIGFTTVTPTPTGVYPILNMGDNDAVTLAMLPSNITLRRVLITAPDPPTPAGPFVQRGMTMNCINCVVADSQCWNIKNAGWDSQCIAVDNSPGPGLIANNYLEATGENIIFNTKCLPTTCAGPNGAPNGVQPAPVPSDFLVIHNDFNKQLSWAKEPAGCVPGGSPFCYTVKNEFEVKHGQRMYITGNRFRNTFNQAQGEFTIINCFPAGPYVCNDITYTNNLFEHGPWIFAISGNGSPHTGQRILIRNNLGLDINGEKYISQEGTAGYGRGFFFQVQRTGSLTIDHNTVINYPPLYMMGSALSDGPPSSDTHFWYTNNIQYAPLLASALSPGETIAALPSPTINQDVFVGDFWPNSCQGCGVRSPTYPAGDNIYTPRSTATPVVGQPPCDYANKPMACWPLDWQAVGMIDWLGASTGANPSGAALAETSPYHNRATDGTDIGANVAAVLAALPAPPPHKRPAPPLHPDDH